MASYNSMAVLSPTDFFPEQSVDAAAPMRSIDASGAAVDAQVFGVWDLLGPTDLESFRTLCKPCRSYDVELLETAISSWSSLRGSLRTYALPIAGWLTESTDAMALRTEDPSAVRLLAAEEEFFGPLAEYLPSDSPRFVDAARLRDLQGLAVSEESIIFEDDGL